MRNGIDIEKELENKARFIDLVNSINVEGMLKKELIAFLEKSDFFEAPASTNYHASYPGGLCQHSLNVYDNLVKLVNTFGMNLNIEEDSIKIVALFHDLSKVNYYEKYLRNVDTGEKDDKGKNIWIKVPEYKIKDGENRFVGVNHEVNSYILASRFIPMREDELIAICNHHCCTGDGNVNRDLSYILDKNPLTTLLHMADFLSTYITESISNEQNS